MKKLVFQLKPKELEAFRACLNSINAEKPWLQYDDKNIAVLTEAAFLQLLLRIEKKAIVLAPKNRFALTIAEASALRTAFNKSALHLDPFSFSVVQPILSRIDGLIG